MTDKVEVLGDHLTASPSIGVLVDGFTPEDQFLRIRNAAGNGPFDSDISSGLISADSPPPLGSIEQIADYLVNGYWGGQSHHFDVTQGGTITVNLTGLTSTGQSLARSALTLWGRIIGVYFADVTTGGQIIFDDNESGAFTSTIYSGHITSSARVNVSTQWLTDYYNGSIDNYAFHYVEFLYHNALGRASDPAGKAGWVQKLNSGAMDRADLLIGFSEAQEHYALTAGLVSHGFFNTSDAYQAVALLYDGFAGRLPDAAGLINWAEAINSGALTLAQVATGFANSTEFHNLTAGMSNTQLVEFMYHNSLDRGSDAAGRDYWVNALDHGLSNADLLLGFSQSAEHTNLLGSHITNGIDYL